MDLSHLKRYVAIHGKLADARYPVSKKDLLEYLKNEEGFRVSERTLERDIADFKKVFGDVIYYDNSHPSRKGYRLKTDSEDSDEFFELFVKLETVLKSDELNEALVRHVRSPVLSIDPIQLSRGSEHVSTLLDAAEERQVMALSYKGFGREEQTEYVLEPLMVAERANRWYVIAYIPGEKRNRTFGLDRILKLEKLERKAVAPRENLIKRMARYVGISLTEGEQQTVKLRVSDMQSKYLQTLPLHKSQKMEPLADGRVEVTLEVIPNRDLEIEILKMGTGAEVLAPADLRQRLAEQVREMAAAYGY